MVNSTESPISALWVGDTVVADLLGRGPGSALPIPAGVSITHTLQPLEDLADLEEICANASADLIFVSIAAGFGQAEPGRSAALQFERELTAGIAACPDTAHVFLLLPSTLIAPSSPIGELHPLTMVLQSRNMVTVSIAARTGVSIIDLDRLVAEMGGSAAVLGPAKYSEPLLAEARTEVVRVLDEYRWLSPDAVPVPQTRNVA